MSNFLWSIHTQAQKISMAINVFINYGPMDGFHNSTKFFVNFVVVVGLSWQAFMIITTQVLSLYYIVSVEACKIICPPKSHLEDTNSLDAMGIQNDPSVNVCPYTQLQYYVHTDSRDTHFYQTSVAGSYVHILILDIFGNKIKINNTKYVPLIFCETITGPAVVCSTVYTTVLCIVHREETICRI